jgi:hypothetical protein
MRNSSNPFDARKGPGMGQFVASAAFAAAMETADCETLIRQIGEWFDKPYRNPTNSLDIAVCVQSAAHTFFSRKVEELRKNWQLGEAKEWDSARIAFDRAMCAAVEAIGRSPEAEASPPQHDPTPPTWGSGQPSSKWGDPSKRPAIGAGWGNRAETA